MRIRTIKPEFFRHESLSLLPAKARLLFIGLWCLADCEGRLEDRPKRIRIEVFPYDVEDIDKELISLSRAGFISRYTAQGVAVIEVTAFKKHQRMTGKEASYASQLPPRDAPGNDGEAPGKHPGNTCEATDDSPMLPGCFTDAQERNKEEGIRSKEKSPKVAKFSPDEFDHLLSPAMASNPEFLQLWHEWLESRHGRKKRVSEHAAKAQLHQIREAGIPAGMAAIRRSIASDYQGLFFDAPAKPAPSAPSPRAGWSLPTC